MSDTPPSSRSPAVAAPFLFRGHGALISELDIDGALRRLPATESEARAIGSLYKSIYDPKNPFASVERAIAKYDGPTERYLFLVMKRPSAASPMFISQDQNGFKTRVPYSGLFDHFFKSVIAFLEGKGVPLPLIKSMLFPDPEPGERKLSTGRWVIGYSRSTGNVTVLDCSQGYEVASQFLAGKNVKPLDLSRFRTSK